MNHNIFKKIMDAVPSKVWTIEITWSLPKRVTIRRLCSNKEALLSEGIKLIYQQLSEENCIEMYPYRDTLDKGFIGKMSKKVSKRCNLQTVLTPEDDKEMYKILENEYIEFVNNIDTEGIFDIARTLGHISGYYPLILKVYEEEIKKN